MSKKIPKRLMFLIMKEANKFSLKEANRIFFKKNPSLIPISKFPLL